MAANGISTLSTKQAKQEAKLALAANNRIGDNRPSVLNTALLPTKYSGNSLIQNSHPTGLQSKRPWLDFTVNNYMQYQSDGFLFDFTKTDRLFQANTGPTLADDVGEAIGLALESREWEGRTLAEELAQQPELRGGGSVITVGTPPSAPTYNTSTGAGFISRTDVSNKSDILIPVADSSATYAVDVENVSGQTLTVRNHNTAVTYYGINSGSRATVFVTDPGSSVKFALGATSGDCTFVIHSLKLVPTHHGVQSSASLKGTRQVFYGYSDDQPELVTNGGFDADIDWSKGTGWTISSGKAVQNGSGTPTSLLDQTVAEFENFESYRIEYTISDFVSGGVRALIYGSGYVGIGSTRTANGTYTEVLTINNSSASAFERLRFQPYATEFNGKIDNVSVRKVPASRITTAAKGDGIDDTLLTNYYANRAVSNEELVENGSFNTDSGWTKGTGWTISGGVANKTAGTGSYLTLNGFVPVPGKTYRVVFTMTKSAGGGFQIDMAGGLGANRVTSGTYTEYVKAVNANSNFKIWGPADIVGTIDNVSVKEVTNQDNFIVAYVNVPTTLSAFQYIAASAEASNTNRFGLGLWTDGVLGVSIGAITPLLDGRTSSGDLRGRTIVVGFTCNGTLVKAFADRSEVLSIAQIGAPNTTIPLHLFAANIDSLIAAHFGGTINKIIAGREFLTIERYLQIRNEMIGN